MMMMTENGNDDFRFLCVSGLCFCIVFFLKTKSVLGIGIDIGQLQDEVRFVCFKLD